MRRQFASLFLALSAGTLLLAEQPLPKIDTALLFHYVDYLEHWPADSELTITTPKPSAAMPGLWETTVERTALGRVVGQRRYFVSADGQHYLKADDFTIGDKPFASNIKLLSRQSSPSIGPADAPVTISAFEDFQCPDCADDTKLVKEQLPAEFGKQIRIVFHDYPLARHKWAMDAAIAGRCAFRGSNELFWNYYSWMFAHQPDINETNIQAKIAEFAAAANAGDSFHSCVANRATETEVKDSIKDALALEVQGTPTLFLNGRMLPILFPNGQMVAPDSQFPALKWLIQFELKTVPPADACCTAAPQ